MRKISVILIIGLLLSCSGSDNPVVPLVPEILLGEYTGKASNTLYSNSDSSFTISADIEFIFLSDSIYYYTMPSDRACGYGGTRYKYENGHLNLKNDMIYGDACDSHPLSLWVGEFRVTGSNSDFLLYQEFPEIDLVRTVELNRVSQ